MAAMMNLLRNIVPLGSSAPLGVQFKTSPDLERSREARISTKAQPHRTFERSREAAVD